MTRERYAVLQCGLVVARFEKIVDAERFARAANLEADDEVGADIVGDGAASVWDTQEEV